MVIRLGDYAILMLKQARLPISREQLFFHDLGLVRVEVSLPYSDSSRIERIR